MVQDDFRPGPLFPFAEDPLMLSLEAFAPVTKNDSPANQSRLTALNRLAVTMGGNMLEDLIYTILWGGVIILVIFVSAVMAANNQFKKEHQEREEKERKEREEKEKQSGACDGDCDCNNASCDSCDCRKN